MVEWMELKTYLAPLFIKEVDSVSEKYLSKYIVISIYYLLHVALIKEIRETNDSDKNEEYIELRNSINQRIEELDKFFEDNFDQPFVFNFEKGRIRLKKLLMYEPSLINQLDNGKGIKGLAFGLKPLKENMNVDNIITNGSYVDEKDKQSGTTTTVLRSQNAKNKKTNSKVQHNRSMEKYKHNNESFDNSKMVKPQPHNKKEQVYNKQSNKKHNEVYNNNNTQNGNDYSYEDNSNCSHNTSHKNTNTNTKQQHKSSSLEYQDSKLYQMNESVTLTRNNNNNNSNHSLVEQSVSGNNNTNNELLRGTSMSFKPNNTNNNVECTANVCENSKHNKDEQPNEHEHENVLPKHINNEIREITLRFKLTEEEYRLLLREKAKIVVQLPEPSSTQPLKHSTAIPNLKKTVSKKPLKQKVNQLYHQNTSSSKYK